MLFIIIFSLLAIILLVWAWVTGIDNMNKKHPDYKGEDFLELKNAPWQDDEWDNQYHNEDV